MEITEIRVKLVGRRGDKLRAFCSIIFDQGFVVRDLKVIEGANGLFVAMPSRKRMDRCAACGEKNHLRAKFCNQCGKGMNPDRAGRDDRGRAKLYADIAHPIHAAAREAMAARIVQAYAEEVEKSKVPGYRPVEMDTDEERYDGEPAGIPTPPESSGVTGA